MRRRIASAISRGARAARSSAISRRGINIDRVMLLSGDRPAEVQYLAELVGIPEVLGGKSPEEKLEIVRERDGAGPTIFVGDGINDAPALIAATVGIAFGQNSDVTTEAADAVVMDSSLGKVDEFLHISRRMRRIALQSALGGMAASTVGMLFAAAGYLPPVAGRDCARGDRRGGRAQRTASGDSAAGFD